MTAKEDKKGNWFARHKILTGVIILVVFIFIIAVSGSDSEPTTVDGTDETAQQNQASSDSAAEDATDNSGIAGGQYRVGTDIDAGEYVIIGTGYLEITSDSSGSFSSIVENDNYVNRTIIEISDGQYVQFAGRAYTWDDAPEVDTSGGELPEGKYKIGVDIPAGEYRVVPSGDGYYSVNSSARDSISSIVTNDNFDSERYLTVQDGQYLKLNRATLRLNN